MQFIKNNSTRILLIILSLALITCCSVGATFAKYTTSAIAQSTARVAKWDVRAGADGNEVYVAGAASQFVNLFEYMVDEDSTEENDVKQEGNIIAPGTRGRFRFDVINNSEVSAEYTVTFTEHNPKDVPIQYSINGNVWHDNASDLNKYFEKIPLAMQGGEDFVIIHWKWDFERGKDEIDTNLGITQPDVSLTIQLTVDQVD